MTMLASQITSLTVVYSIVYSGVNQRKHQSSAPLAFVWEIREFPAQMASNAENVSIWWRHHVVGHEWHYSTGMPYFCRVLVDFGAGSRYGARAI